jgi:hypothetical protein
LCKVLRRQNVNLQHRLKPAPAAPKNRGYLVASSAGSEAQDLLNLTPAVQKKRLARRRASLAVIANRVVDVKGGAMVAVTATTVVTVAHAVNGLNVVNAQTATTAPRTVNVARAPIVRTIVEIVASVRNVRVASVQSAANVRIALIVQSAANVPNVHRNRHSSPQRSLKS